MRVCCRSVSQKDHGQYVGNWFLLGFLSVPPPPSFPFLYRRTQRLLASVYTESAPGSANVDGDAFITLLSPSRREAGVEREMTAAGTRETSSCLFHTPLDEPTDGLTPARLRQGGDGLRVCLLSNGCAVPVSLWLHFVALSGGGGP